MLGWMDDEALHRTLTTGRATYWSRSRQEYWVKGETSGHRQWVKEVRLDCDGDALLVKVDQEGRRLPHRRPHLLRRGRAPRARWLSRSQAAAPSARSSWSQGSRAPPWRWPGHSRGSCAEGDDITAAAKRPARGSRRRRAWCRPRPHSPWSCWRAWGVVLVTRGRFRRVVSVVGLLAAHRWARARSSRRTSGARRSVRDVADAGSASTHPTSRSPAGTGSVPWRRSWACSPGSRAVRFVRVLAGDGQPLRRAGRGHADRTRPELELWKAHGRGARPHGPRLSRAVRRHHSRSTRCPHTTATPPPPGRPS